MAEGLFLEIDGKVSLPSIDITDKLGQLTRPWKSFLCIMLVLVCKLLFRFFLNFFAEFFVEMFPVGMKFSFVVCKLLAGGII